MSEELKPCHCGQPAKVVWRAGGWTVDCCAADPFYCVVNNVFACPLDCGTTLASTRERAIVLWHTRPVEDALRAELEAVKVELQQAREALRWIPVNTMPDTDGDLHFVKLESGYITTEFYHFSDGWATDDDIAFWMPIPPEQAE